MKKLNYLSIISLATVMLSGCISSDQKFEVESVNTEIIQQQDSREKVERIKKIFHTLPSPLELTSLFKKEGTEYKSEKLHDIAKRADYNTSMKKALNLGIYGADLSYAGLFGQHEDAIQFFTVTQLIAGDLGIGQTFQEEFITRLENNAGNKDTLLAIVEQFFIKNDNYLKEHEEQDVSTLVLAGGWIEGMYIGVNMSKGDSSSAGVRNIIANQRYALHNLVILLQNINNEQNSEMVTSIGELEGLFQELITGPKESIQSDSILTADLQSPDLELSDSSLSIISEKVSAIRNKIIQL